MEAVSAWAERRLLAVGATPSMRSRGACWRRGSPRGVKKADLIPTFMACERTYTKDGYYGAAKSRRRAEYHGEAGEALNGSAASSLKNTFAAWRAVFQESRESGGETLVLEFVPTGALLEAVVDGGTALAREHRLLEEPGQVAAWWQQHGAAASHEQFFPEGLRISALPARLDPQAAVSPRLERLCSGRGGPRVVQEAP